MANYWGPQTVDISSYDNFRNAIIGNGYDVDNLFGAQCIDLFKLINYNLGYPSPYAKTGPNGYVSECWTNTSSRIWNQSDKYDLITDITQLQRGDMVIMDGTTTNPPGHNAFCDSNYGDYSGYIPVVGQNQGGTPFPGGGAVTNIINWPLDNFLGAFRLKAWHESPTPTIIKKSKFPWVLYARKFRIKR